jgi:glutamate N-acetyltransferase/amino-acid N-acetyltransferase
MILKGFTFSAVQAGIKYSGRLDLGLLYSAVPAVTAGVFTRSLVKAAPVVLDMERLRQGRAQAILVNSGCANACTGEAGMEAAKQTSRLVAKPLGIAEDMVQVASTGVIGLQLNVPAFEAAMGPLVSGLAPENFEKVAQAIMTTDTVLKTAYRSLDMGGKQINLMGMAKGAGMIMPNMATMLAFIVTDAQIGFPELNRCLKAAVARTFNRITIDGDTSTNDMVLVMANGAAGNTWIDEETPEALQLFQETLESVLKELALKIVADGEGATKCITLRVCGARESEEAECMARTVANSNLVKTAFFGEDANWGRIMAAMGRCGVRFHPEQVDISFGDVCIVKNGMSQGAAAEDAATAILKEKNITVTIDLKDGNAVEEIYTCDFSLDYVKINADYRS